MPSGAEGSPDEGQAAGGDLHAQLHRLKAELEGLITRAAPGLAEQGLAGAAHDAAQSARLGLDEMADQLRARVRAEPLAAVLIAAGIGFLLGRTAR